MGFEWKLETKNEKMEEMKDYIRKFLREQHVGNIKETVDKIIIPSEFEGWHEMEWDFCKDYIYFYHSINFYKGEEILSTIQMNLAKHSVDMFFEEF